MRSKGLDALVEANERAKRDARKVVAPRQPLKAVPPVASQESGEPDSAAEQAAVTTEVPAAAPVPAAVPAPVEPAVDVALPAEPARSAPSTIARSVQLDEPSEDLLDRVRSAGRKQQVDANRSATIRLALRRLEDQLSPEEIAAELKKSAAEKNVSGAGRRTI